MKVKIELKETSQALEYDAANAYTKGDLYCVYYGGEVIKIPLANIWHITETYR